MSEYVVMCMFLLESWDAERSGKKCHRHLECLFLFEIWCHLQLCAVGYVGINTKCHASGLVIRTATDQCSAVRRVPIMATHRSKMARDVDENEMIEARHRDQELPRARVILFIFILYIFYGHGHQTKYPPRPRHPPWHIIITCTCIITFSSSSFSSTTPPIRFESNKISISIPLHPFCFISISPLFYAHISRPQTTQEPRASA